MFKKTADLLGNTDLPIVGTPKIVGNIPINSDEEFTGLRNNGMCEFRVEIKPSVSPYTPIIETFDFDTNTVFTLTTILVSLNSQTSYLVFNSVEGCLSIESVYSGHKAYIKILTKTTGAYIDPLPYLGLFADPHPSSYSEAKDLEPAPVKPESQGNRHGAAFVARKEDKLSSSVNRALASVAFNSEHTQHHIEKPLAIGIEFVLDETAHSYRLHKNTLTDTYEYVWLGNSGLNDTIDRALDGRRIFVGGLSSVSHLRDIQKAFLLKTLDNRTVLADSLEYQRIGGGVSRRTNPAGITTISAPTFDSTGAQTGTPLANSQALYDDFGNVFGVDIPLYTGLSIISFTTSTIVFSSTIPNAEVGFKVEVTGSNPMRYSNDGTYIITKIISDTEIEVKPYSSEEPRILNSAAIGTYTPTATISSGGEFIHNLVLLFEPNFVFPSEGQIKIALYVESSLESYGAGVQADTLQSRFVTLGEYTVGLNTSFQGINPAGDSGYFIRPDKRGIQIQPSGRTSNLPDIGSAVYTSSSKGTINSSHTLTATVGDFFYEDDVGALFLLDDTINEPVWYRSVQLIDYKTLSLVPMVYGQSLSGTAFYTKYSEPSDLNYPGLVTIKSKYSDSTAEGYVFIENKVPSSISLDLGRRGFSHLNKFFEGEEGETQSGTGYITYPNYNLARIRPLSENGSTATIIEITNGSSAGFYLVIDADSTALRVSSLSGDSVSFSATETIWFSGYSQTFATGEFYQKSSGDQVYSSLSAHGFYAPGESAAISIDWESEGAGIYARINPDRVSESYAASGYLIDAEIAVPAQGVKLYIEGNTGSSDPDLSGAYGLNIVTTSAAFNLDNITTYTAQQTIPPKSAISVMNYGLDSSITAVRGYTQSSYWDSPVVDIRQGVAGVHGNVWGAGSALSVEGSWYSREQVGVYLAGEDSIIACDNIIPTGFQISPRLGSPKVLYSYTSSQGTISVSGPDYTEFNFPHSGVISVPESIVYGYEFPGHFLNKFTAGNITYSSMILAVKPDGLNTLMAVQGVIPTVPVDEIRVVGSRFRMHADVESYLQVGHDGEDPEEELPTVSKSGASPAIKYEWPSDFSNGNFPYESWALGTIYNRLHFYNIDSYDGNNSEPMPALSTNYHDVYSIQDYTNADRDDEFSRVSFMDLYKYYYLSSYTSESGTPGGHAQFSFGDTLLYPRTSYTTLALTATNGTGSHGDYITGSGHIKNRVYLNSPTKDSFFIKFPTPYTIATMPDRNLNIPAFLDVRFVEWYKAMQVAPHITEGPNELNYHFCRLGAANFNINNYSIQIKASVGIQQFNADSNQKIEVTPFIAIVNTDDELYEELSEGLTVQIVSLFQTVQYTFSATVTDQSERTYTPMEYAEGVLLFGLKVRHYYITNPTGSADITLNRFYVRSMEVVETSKPLRVGNIEAYGNVIAPSFQLSVWKSGGQTVSPAHVDLFTEQTPMPMATHHTDDLGDLSYKYGRIGANGVGAVKTSEGQWWRPTYQFERFFSKGTHAATIDLYHPFHDPLWYAYAGERSFQYADDPNGVLGQFTTIEQIMEWTPNISVDGLQRVVMPGPTGFTIPLNPPNGAILTSMDWNLFMQSSQGSMNNAPEAECWGAFWADKPAGGTTGAVNFYDALSSYGNLVHSLERWNRVAGVRINLYRFNCMGSNQTEHHNGGFSLTGPMAFRSGAELIWTTISACTDAPYQSTDSSGRKLISGRPLRGSAKFYAEGIDPLHPELDAKIHEPSENLGPDLLGIHQNHKLIVDTNNYSYFATITFYGGSRLPVSELPADRFTYVNRGINGEDTLGFANASNISAQSLSPVAVPYAMGKGGSMDLSSTPAGYLGNLIGLGFDGFRVTGPNYNTYTDHIPHFTPKVHFRGFKLNWKTNKI